MDTSLIPVNTEGKPNNIEHSRAFKTRTEAVACFNRACYRLLHPELWHGLAGILSGSCTLVSTDGREERGPALPDDYVRIDIPGPGTSAGDGYDWVRVDAMEDKTDHSAEEESFGMRLRPCANPWHENEDTAHFFKNVATSTFIIYRHNNNVIASYHGRNELPNMDTDSIRDNIRNTIVAAGAVVGFSEMQWTALMKSFLEDDK